jgi:predicted DCC family thiol-disulfide oxidoreductase YuxK
MKTSTIHPFIVYYDGGCPLCRREIGFYQRQRGAENIQWLNLLGAEPRQLGADLSPAAAMARFHVRDDGQLCSGALAFALLWQQLPRFRVAGRIAALPGLVHVLELGYRIVLRLRKLWRKPDAVCELPPR